MNYKVYLKSKEFKTEEDLDRFLKKYHVIDEHLDDIYHRESEYGDWYEIVICLHAGNEYEELIEEVGCPVVFDNMDRLDGDRYYRGPYILVWD